MALKLITGAGATGAGGKYEDSLRASSSSMQVVVTGTLTALTVDLEGSNDGTNFVSLGSLASTTGGLLFVTKPVRFVRANITAYTGTGTVSAFYVGGK